MRLTDMDLLSSRLATSSQIRSRKCLRTQSMTNRLGASSLSVLGSCSACRGKIQVLSCCSLISPSRQEIHCCQIGFNLYLLVCFITVKNSHSPFLYPCAVYTTLIITLYKSASPYQFAQIVCRNPEFYPARSQREHMVTSRYHPCARFDRQYYTYPQPTQRGKFQFHQCFTRISLRMGRLIRE